MWKYKQSFVEHKFYKYYADTVGFARFTKFDKTLKILETRWVIGQ